jgi:hypothetical protein
MFVAWYGILFDKDGEGIFIARKNPEPGTKVSDQIYLRRGVDQVPVDIKSFSKNATADAIKNVLSNALGIAENEHRPPDGQTRNPLQANSHHSLLFCLQAQDEVASRRFLFHRQGEQWLPQTIRDTLPYFLGAMDEDRFYKQMLFDNAKKRLRKLERQLTEAQAIEDGDFSRARRFLGEAKRVGLLDRDVREPEVRYQAVKLLQEALTNVQSTSNIITDDPQADLEELYEQRRSFRNQLTSWKEEIRDVKVLLSEASGFEREATEQRSRLTSIGLIKHNQETSICPVCENHLTQLPPSVRDIQELLTDISDQLVVVQKDNPRLHERLSKLENNRSEVEDKLREVQRTITARVQENERLRAQQDIFIQRAQVAGRIDLYLETLPTITGDDGLKSQIRALSAEVEELEKALDTEIVEERVTTALNIVGRYMTEYAEHLDLEHGGNPIRIDRKHLTVVSDTEDGPIPLTEMGSAENWIGYHIVAHLGLHKLFRNKQRPVPGFLIMDQPSQAHYPPENDEEGDLDDLKVIEDADKAAVHRIFELLNQFTAEFAPNMQMIIIDHVDINQPWFKSAIVERWRHGRTLVPSEWIQS